MQQITVKDLIVFFIVSLQSVVSNFTSDPTLDRKLYCIIDFHLLLDFSTWIYCPFVFQYLNKSRSRLPSGKVVLALCFKRRFVRQSIGQGRQPIHLSDPWSITISFA